MSNKKIANSKHFVVNLDNESYVWLVRKAASETIKAGKQVSISSVLKDIVKTLINKEREE